jgi:cytochrome c oxidase accessory protein FixG
MLFVLSAMLAVFLVTALFGRVWCGWACPQTVYMEFLFRPVERWIEGGWRGRERITVRHPLPRRITKWVIFAALSFVLAHVFLAYFVPVGELLQWMRRSPVEHPTSFLIVLGTTALVLFDFGWFREQTCLVACPYGRLQSALLDRRSLIVGYDARRGEPRARRGPQREAGAGDCVDCRSCVLTCPTGIDIREGLQMECIHCTQCMDACDYVMTKIGRPTGLIRYASQDGLDGRASRRLRPRVVLYPAALALCVTLLVVGLSTRTHPDVTLLHGLGVAYTRGEGDAVVNQVRIKVANRTATTGHYRIALLGAPEATMIVPIDPMPVAPGAMATQSVFVSLPPGAFRAGERAVRFRISDERGWSETLPYRLVGPEPGEGGHAEPAEGRR